MLLSSVSVLVVAQSSSEIPDGLMNNPVLYIIALNWDGTCIEKAPSRIRNNTTLVTDN
jgi:hypothetical protein